jgi:hypothetical protein
VPLVPSLPPLRCPPFAHFHYSYQPHSLRDHLYRFPLVFALAYARAPRLDTGVEFAFESVARILATSFARGQSLALEFARAPQSVPHSWAPNRRPVIWRRQQRLAPARRLAPWLAPALESVPE